ISVITICFNNLTDLQKTCASIDMQTRLPDEHWVINGSTTDEIAQWLQQTPQPAYRKWINERDKGISDAFNKGIGKANGEITHLLHAGDSYASGDVLETVEQFFISNPGIQWISGNIQLIRAGRPVVVGKPFEKEKLYRGMRSVSHPTWFVKKEVYARIGTFSNEYKIGMDYDLMCRIACEPYAYLDKTITVFDDTGISSTNYLRSMQESRKIYESYFGFSPRLVAWQFRLKLLHYLLQTSFGKGLFGLKKGLGFENW
ncbi:MAG: glycosyltransferase, partial [Sediminibacterium sp.]